MLGPAELTGVDWRLESDRKASFRTDDGQLRGTDSCNRIFGGAEVTGVAAGEKGVIEFGVLGSTRMACPDSTGAQENMRRALAGQRLIKRPDDTTLVLADEASGGAGGS